MNIITFLLKNKRYLWVILASLSIFIYFNLKNVKILKETIKAKNEIITTNQKNYRDNLDRAVNETNTWRLTAADLSNANKQYQMSLNNKDVVISQQQKALAEIYEVAESQGRRIKDLQSASSATMQTLNNLRTQLNILEDSLGNLIVQIDTIRTDHLELAFDFVPPDSLDISHKYWNTLYTLVEVRAARKDDGSKRWFFGNWIWLWGAEYNTSVTSKDTSATITNNISIQLNDKRIR